MANPKNYLHDHYVLLLASINSFLAIAGIIFVIVKLISINHVNGYIVQYRPSLGVGSYQTGSIDQLISFSIFALLILIINIALSYKAYKIHRQLAQVILVLGILLLIMNIIISNALLKLR